MRGQRPPRSAKDAPASVRAAVGPTSKTRAGERTLVSPRARFDGKDTVARGRLCCATSPSACTVGTRSVVGQRRRGTPLGGRRWGRGARELSSTVAMQRDGQRADSQRAQTQLAGSSPAGSSPAEATQVPAMERTIPPSSLVRISDLVAPVARDFRISGRNQPPRESLAPTAALSGSCSIPSLSELSFDVLGTLLSQLFIMAPLTVAYSARLACPRAQRGHLVNDVVHASSSAAHGAR